MKKLLLIIIFLFILTVTPSVVFAQGMMGNWTSSSSSVASDDHTASEEAEGKEIWDKLQAKQLECKNLTDNNYEVLGEFFMGQSIGNTERHAVMNQMMTNMMGQNGEKQMHIALGKRSSGCETNASFPSGYGLPMMWWMIRGGGNSMMGGWGGFGLSWIFMIVFWILIILGVVALVRYLGGTKQNGADKTSMDILKERYAKGEINKKEFEEMKKDLR